MRQLNGCSTPAPRSSAAKQWIEELARTTTTPFSKDVLLIAVQDNIFIFAQSSNIRSFAAETLNRLPVIGILQSMSENLLR